MRAYLNGLKEQSLDQPLDLPCLGPIIPQNIVPELSPRERFNAAARLRKALAKNRWKLVKSCKHACVGREINSMQSTDNGNLLHKDGGQRIVRFVVEFV